MLLEREEELREDVGAGFKILCNFNWMKMKTSKVSLDFIYMKLISRTLVSVLGCFILGCRAQFEKKAQ